MTRLYRAFAALIQSISRPLICMETLEEIQRVGRKSQVYAHIIYKTYMYVYVCMYMYVCMYIYICIYTHTHTHTHIYIYIHIYIFPGSSVEGCLP
jgi:hypothetical protein